MQTTPQPRRAAIAQALSEGVLQPIALQDIPNLAPDTLLRVVAWREPYSTARGTFLVPECAIKALNTTSTSALFGLTNRLRAIARAVRSRSYAAMAAFSSLAGTPARCMACSRVSNASVPSMVAPSVMGVVRDAHRKSDRGNRQHPGGKE